MQSFHDKTPILASHINNSCEIITGENFYVLQTFKSLSLAELIKNLEVINNEWAFVDMSSSEESENFPLYC